MQVERVPADHEIGTRRASDEPALNPPQNIAKHSRRRPFGYHVPTDLFADGNDVGRRLQQRVRECQRFRFDSLLKGAIVRFDRQVLIDSRRDVRTDGIDEQTRRRRGPPNETNRVVVRPRGRFDRLPRRGPVLAMPSNTFDPLGIVVLRRGRNERHAQAAFGREPYGEGTLSRTNGSSDEDERHTERKCSFGESAPRLSGRKAPGVTPLDFALAALGALTIALALNDIFQSVVVPRAVGRQFRPSFVLWRAMWWMWPRLSWKIYPSDGDGREDFLATFAPFTLIVMLVMWAALCCAGFGVLFWAMRSQLSGNVESFGQAMYFAGSSFFTIGFGDITGRTGLTRFLSILAGASGIGTVSITTAFLFAIFGSFQARETFVVTMGARSGSPPSGVGMLAIAGYAGIADDMNDMLRAAETWTALVMESHLAYPVLAFFRSSHDYESWVGTLGTLLDASLLLMTTIDGGTGQARILYTIALHATHDLSKYFRTGETNVEVGVDRSEFEMACDRLASAGYRLRDREESWARFADLRKTYAGQLNGMARFFQIPPLQWVGDRSFISMSHVRAQLSPAMLKKYDQKP